MPTKKLVPTELTDEEVLEEFVKRFQCDAAVLIYLDSKREFGFGRWHTGTGRAWVNNVFKVVKQNVFLREDKAKAGPGFSVRL